MRSDRVEYGAGFPWPAAPDGGGPSVERIHPSLDGNLAGSWRASGTLPEGDPPAPIIPLQQTGWRIFRGTTEASTPIQAWRDTNFDDAAWETGRPRSPHAGEPVTITERRRWAR